jgi:uncharacterized protein (TIRG00374 family)
MVRRIGVESIGKTIMSVGWWAALMMLSRIVTLLLNTAAIRIFMRPEQRMVSFGRVLVAQLSGQAVNSVTPMGAVGEVLKVTMLMGYAPRYRAVSSIVAFNVCVVFTNACLMIFALVVALLFADLPGELDWILRVVLALLSVTTLLGIYLLRNGFVSAMTKFASQLHVISKERRERLLSRLESFDSQLRMFGPKKEANYTSGYALVALARIIGWFDLWLVLHALGVDEGFVFIVVAASAGTVIDKLASIVPLGVGAKEGGEAGLYQLLGAGAMVGLALSLINRIRVMLIAAIGLLVMLLVQFIDDAALRRARRRIVERSTMAAESVDPE